MRVCVKLLLQKSVSALKLHWGKKSAHIQKNATKVGVLPTKYERSLEN